jgi:hypothetical protein
MTLRTDDSDAPTHATRNSNIVNVSASELLGMVEDMRDTAPERLRMS